MMLATPVRPIEVMVGKIAPFIIVGYIQVTVIMVAAKFLFDVPVIGSLVTLSLALVVRSGLRPVDRGAGPGGAGHS